jgi:hypothetical protein
VRNPLRKDGRWKFDGKLAVVYAKNGAENIEEKITKLKVAF